MEEDIHEIEDDDDDQEPNDAIPAALYLDKFNNGPAAIQNLQDHIQKMT